MTDTLLSLAILIPLCPLLAFFAIVFFGRKLPRQGAGVALGAMVVAFTLMLLVNGAWLSRLAQQNAVPFEKSLLWLRLGAAPGLQNVSLSAGYLVDSATAVLLFVVTAVGSLIFWFAMGYMEGDPWYPRFFAYMSLFAAAMLGVVISNSLLWFFICWEIMGLCSYLLIGYWYDKPSAMRAAKKAFVVTRVGDVGFFIGILTLYLTTSAHTLTFSQIFSPAEMAHLDHTRWVFAGFPIPALTAIALLIFCGSIGKSAQFPLHVWLPDAMEGPTPVSALIHAATMVAAGVYLVARTYPIFVYPALHHGSSTALLVVAGIGAFTVVFSATMAVAHFDIKKVLAYSTISQLGYMFMALGSFGWSAALFHLMTHAWFKALLFLGSGSVFHSTHTYDMRKMGGLWKKMPTTGWTFGAGCLALSGVPIFSGFWSKDAILNQAWRANGVYYKFIFAFGMFGALLTAFYTWRMFFLTFQGEARDEHIFEHAHESPKIMTIPLAILAIGAISIGWLGIPIESINVFGNTITLSTPFATAALAAPEQPFLTWMMALFSIIVVGIGWWLAYAIYIQGRLRAPEEGGLRRWGLQGPYYLASRLWYVDEIYSDSLVAGTMALSDMAGSFDNGVVDGAFVNGSALLTIWFSKINDWFDRSIVDGMVRLVAGVSGKTGDVLRRVQQGVIQVYALIVFVSVFALIIVVYYLR